LHFREILFNCHFFENNDNFSFIFFKEKKMPCIFFKPLHPDAVFPSRATPESAGLDLYATQAYSIPSFSVQNIPIGLSAEIPRGYFGKIFDRSSIAMKQVITLGGIIDSDYRGELIVILFNLSSETYHIQKGDRIAQMICSPYIGYSYVETNELSFTQRGTKGFGSSGR
jgi:dUTP pyrophosphatase